jgi:arsenite methyltransferase
VALPVADGSFDAALAVQVIEFVPDAQRALADLHRALRPGGRVLVWDIDWATVSLHSEDPVRSERVLRAWDGQRAHRSLPRTLGPLLRAAGFTEVRMSAHPFATLGADPDSFGASLVPLIGSYAAGREGISDEDAAAWVEEQRRLEERGDFYFACTQLCFTARKPV